jgi:hypothetical protein
MEGLTRFQKNLKKKAGPKPSGPQLDADAKNFPYEHNL